MLVLCVFFVMSFVFAGFCVMCEVRCWSFVYMGGRVLRWCVVVCGFFLCCVTFCMLLLCAFCFEVCDLLV